MKYIESEVTEDVAYVIPIGDLHLGDRAFTKESRKLLDGYLAWVNEHSNARIFLVGDIFNCATRNSKTSPFEQTKNELERAIEIFEPYKDKIIGAILGNHENRLEDFADFSIMNAFCLHLGIPYCGASAAVNVKVGLREDGKRFRQQYLFYFHHTTGGGKTVGSKMNRVADLTNIVANADIYCGAHNHQLGAVPLISQFINIRKKGIVQQKQWLVDCGSYLQWEGYPERMGLRPTKLGSPRIRLDSTKDHKDIHVSL